MVFVPFVVQAESGRHIKAVILPAEQADIDATRGKPHWQTDWSSEYLSAPSVEKYALKSLEGELIALAAYGIRGHSAYVFILYAESAPHSNPTMNPKERRKYYGIGNC